MTDDIIRKATTADYIETIDNLRAEVERLQRLMDVVENTSRLRSNRLEEQIEALVIQKSAKAARIKELEAAVVDGRAQYLLFLDCNPDCTAWNFDELLEEDQNTLRRQARIILEMEEPWAYVQLREAREQVKLLEAAFLRSNAAMRYYQEGNRGPWPQLGEKFKEPYQEKAREALKRIKEGGKDE